MAKLSSLLALSFSLIFAQASLATQREPLIIACASSFHAPLKALVNEFAKAGNISIVSHSSGAIIQQISQGAPYDIFISAAPEYAQQLTQLSAQSYPAHTFAAGHSYLWLSSQLANIHDLKQLAALPPLRIALPSPNIAPVGNAGLQALDVAGIKANYVYANNAAQSLQLLYTGHVDAAVIANSQVKAIRRKQTHAHFISLPNEPDALIHSAIRLSDKNEAQRFMQFMQGNTAKQVLRSFAFEAL